MLDIDPVDGIQIVKKGKKRSSTSKSDTKDKGKVYLFQLLSFGNGSGTHRRPKSRNSLMESGRASR